jgi:hypothetical protein
MWRGGFFIVTQRPCFLNRASVIYVSDYAGVIRPHIMKTVQTVHEVWGVRAGTHYPHVTWAHVMLRVQLGCERWFNIEFYGADSHFCHSTYVTWSHVELWSAQAPARLSHFCCRTHFVRRNQRVECSRALDTKYVRQQKCERRAGAWADQSSTWDHVT